VIRNSLESRLTLQQQGLAVLVIAAFAISALWITRATLFREETQTLRSGASRIALSLDIEFAESQDLGKAIGEVLRQEAVDGLPISFEDAQGRVLASNHSRRGATPGRSTQIHEARLQAKCGVWVVVAMSDRLRERSLAALARSLTIAALPLLLLTLVLSRWTVRRALKPLQEMAHQAGALSLDDGTQRLGGSSGLVELERLRVAFDRLLARLSEKLRAERQFASDASHELRTPLTVLTGEIELASARQNLDSGTRESLEHAADQIRAMRELVEALMLLHRASEGALSVRKAFEPVDLSDVLDAAMRSISSRHPGRWSDIQVHAGLDVMVSGHPVLLAAGVRNLLDNAIKFTAAGTRVRVTIMQDQHWAGVYVEDAGPGIDASEYERLFDPFFRGTEARANNSGFGLGLPILRRVARVHGGDVTVARSSLGGARFELQLPRWRPESQTAQAG
jgi:signal transduction histidine kinase